MPSIGRFFIITGIVLVLLGLLFILFSKKGVGGLPGDIMFKKGGFTIVIPVITSILLSVILTILLNLILRR